MNKIILYAIISVIAFILSSIGYVSLDYFEDQEDIEQLQLVLDSCECQADANMGCEWYGASYYNGTHYIDNNSCEWQEAHCIFGSLYFPRDGDDTQKIIHDGC